MNRARALASSPRRALSIAIAVTAFAAVALLAVPELRSLVVWLVLAGPIGWVASQFPNESKQTASTVLGWFAKVSERAELESTRQDLEGTLSIGVGHLRDACPQATVSNFRLDYVRTEEAVRHLDDGTLVIGIAERHDRVRNLVTAAYALVRHGVIPQSRPYLDEEVSQAIDFVLTKSILSATNTHAVSDFLATVWSPAVLGRERLRSLTDQLAHLQASALLAPIVLSEFNELALRVGERFPTDEVAEETAKFVDYLGVLSRHKPGEYLGDITNFEGRAIRCRVVFVPTSDYTWKGPRPYRDAIEWSMTNAFHHLYLLASGQRIDQLREVVAPYLTDPRVREVSEFVGVRPNLKGRPVEQLVIRLAFDVHYYVGFGQRPIVAVGPGRPRASATRRERFAKRRSA